MPSQEIPKAQRKTEEEKDPRPEVKSELYDLKRNIKYHIGKCIGKGGFAKCYEAKLASNGQVMCCKTLWKAKLKNTTEQQRVRTEMNILRILDHPNVVKFYSAMEDTDYVYFFMEICRRGNLKELLKLRKTLTEPEVRFYMLQLISAVEHFMKNRVIHRDLKLANIFVSEDMTLRIGDFGLAGRLEAWQDRRTTRCGTPNYTAPEVLEHGGHSYEVDMWALGIIMYTLIVGVPPFQTKDDLKLTYHKIRSVDLHFPPGTKISSEAIDLITLILKANPMERPDFQQVRNHPFFNEYTPPSLPQDALRFPPQFPDNTNAVAKRTLDSEGFARPSLIPGPSTPHKKTKFGSAPQAVSPAPLKKQYSFEGPITEKENQKPIENKPTIQPEDQPKVVKPSSYMVEDMHNVYTRAKELIALGYTAAEIESQIGEADLAIPNFISKWISHEADYGFVYEFIDGTSGVLFNDATTLSMSPNKKQLEQIKVHGGERLATLYSRPQFQELNPGKMALFDRFTEDLNSASPAISDDVKQSTLPPSLHSPSKTYSGLFSMPYVVKVNKSKVGTFVQLSTGSIQMNIAGDHKFVLSDKGRCLVAIPRKGNAIQSYSLVDVLMRYEHAIKSGRPVEARLSALHSRLIYFLGVLGNIVQRNAKKAALPQKSPLSKQV